MAMAKKFLFVSVFIGVIVSLYRLVLGKGAIGQSGTGDGISTEGSSSFSFADSDGDGGGDGGD